MPHVAPHVITLDDLKLGADDQVPQPDDPRYAWRILAEGDSWFSIGAIPSSNLVYELGLADASIVLNLAYPGDTVDNMSSLAGNPDLVKMLHDEDWAYAWDLILLSGGGNDLIDRAGEIIRAASRSNSRKASEWVDAEALNDLVSDVQRCYRAIGELRDEAGTISTGVPIVAHTYDYSTPRNAPARFLFSGIGGPWLHPVFEAIEAPAGVRMAVSRYVMDRLAEGIIALSKGPDRIPEFHVVDTRRTLEPAAADEIGNSNDWLNEIHPNHQGYRKIARKISRKIAAVLKT